MRHTSSREKNTNRDICAVAVAAAANDNNAKTTNPVAFVVVVVNVVIVWGAVVLENWSDSVFVLLGPVNHHCSPL